jgi:hypothetical protein
LSSTSYWSAISTAAVWIRAPANRCAAILENVIGQHLARYQARGGCFFLSERAESVSIRNKGISIPKHKGFCNSPVVAWKPNAAIEAGVRGEFAAWGDYTISVDVLRGDSIAATATLFSCSCRRLFCERDWSLRSLDSVRVEAREGKTGGCRAHATIGE